MKPRIAPLAGASQDGTDRKIGELVELLGYRPNALLTMARKAGLLDAVLALIQATLRGDGSVPPELRLLVACEACRGAQCFYSAVHAVHASHQLGVSWEKLDALADYRTSIHFSEKERAALSVASAGATSPVGPTDAAFDSAAQHFSEEELLEIVGVVALFGWFNRWNSLVGTTLEAEPATAIGHVGWLTAMARPAAN